MFLEVALSGSRTRAEHPAVPLTSIQQAREASAALAAGAEAGHVHVRGADGRESLAPEDVAATLLALRAACPGAPIGISTGAWIVPDAGRRLALIGAWEIRPDFASVNLHEEGAIDTIRVDGSAWELLELAARRRYATRIGFEDTLTLPDGSRAESNAALVAAARRPIGAIASAGSSARPSSAG